ncbi:arylesterase [Laribacter hongkongensis]|uniref:Arylesterase n=1 Tax=Laribacter hongkongensis TaxID=168471 RepID=A0A248LKM4_9NEIS|nr:arylesterase [Laribacter hongkongensis]ASJ25095.1 TesA [Laribacter hongkongensis]MCG8992055.1 arylesterase [Laribacter hongkongensis]MCG8998646.1 arylesterase [Laribacter hongkongensis]MCG9002035.1 arylesterase [Laribacter hongkongensis]MCG9005256.1 arylesterase [Laribacter hongkongensis]
MRYVFWLLAGWTSLACVPALAATVMVFGDSLSAGYGLKAGEGWVSLLARELAPRHRVINASVSGETSAGGLTRLPAALQQHKPDVLILALGGNDGLRGLPPAELRDNLDRMVELARARRTRVLLVGIELPPNYGPRYTREFAAVYDEVARNRKLPLVPSLIAGFGADRSMFQPDAIHPVAAAQPRMLSVVKPALQPLLKDAR